jgi:hypothetical protein
MPATDMSLLEPAVQARISAARADFERRNWPMLMASSV